MARSSVVLVKSRNVWSGSGELDTASVIRMLGRGLELLTGQIRPRDGVLSLFSPDDRVGIKINTIGGRSISTRPELSLSLGLWLARNGLQEKEITIWDRTNRELAAAGYKIAAGRNGIKVFGTDTGGVGYGSDLVSNENVGSLFSTIQADFITASISLAILKDHGLAGITAGMKNYFGAIHNPNKYHDTHCDPFVAEVFDTPPVKRKHRLSVLDALVVQYHRGPSFHPQWAEKCGVLIFSRDPVAADRVGWDLIERLRAAKGLPSLSEEGREPSYLATAERSGLGRLSLSDIDVLEENIR